MLVLGTALISAWSDVSKTAKAGFMSFTPTQRNPSLAFPLNYTKAAYLSWEKTRALLYMHLKLEGSTHTETQTQLAASTRREAGWYNLCGKRSWTWWEETSEPENQTWSSPCSRTPFSMPCTVRYVTADCLHTQLWWGMKGNFREVTQNAGSCKTQPPLNKKNYRQKRTSLSQQEEWITIITSTMQTTSTT